MLPPAAAWSAAFSNDLRRLGGLLGRRHAHREHAPDRLVKYLLYALRSFS